MWAGTGRRQARHNIFVAEEEDFPVLGPRSLESITTFKVLKKKKKGLKDASIDLSEVISEVMSEVETLVATDDTNSSTTLILLPSPDETYDNHNHNHDHNHNNHYSHNSDVKNISVIGCEQLQIQTSPSSTIHEQADSATTFTPSRESTDIAQQLLFENLHKLEYDSDPTPTRARFDSVILSSPSSGTRASGLDYYHCDGSDTQSTKDREEQVMSHIQSSFGARTTTLVGNDAFETLCWDPNLPSGRSEANSPEPATLEPVVPIKTQPVAYTTVGSLVDPNAKPQFSAPHRIQREGAGRQPLMSMLQRGQYESFYPPRGPPPPLSMANSMAYTQQIAKSPGHAPKQTVTPPETLNRTLRQAQQVPDKAADVMKFLQPRINSETQSTTPSTPTPLTSNKLSANALEFGTKDQMDDNRDQGNNRFVTISNSERPNIPDYLSRFENAFGKLKFARSNRGAQVESITNLYNSSLAARIDNNGRGELDRTYQFPPPGLQASNITQANPLLGAYSTTRNHPPGYPQPLTAGPPGQRQPLGSGARPATSHLEGIWARCDSSAGQSHSGNILATSQSQSTWINACQVPSSSIYDAGRAVPVPQGFIVEQLVPPKMTDPFAPPRLVDTLPPDQVKQYFPYGIPVDMTGAYIPLSDEKQTDIDNLEFAGRAVQTTQMKQAKDLEDWFYGGQRRYATMDGGDHVSELETRQQAASSPYGPIALPKRVYPPGPAIKAPITIEEMEKMSVAEAAKTPIEAAFGTLLGYADSGPKSRKNLSGFIASPKWQIDESESGNMTMFGEDWGAPPKRYGRDPRYQN